MSASILLHEEDVGVLNALSHIKFFVSFICSGIQSVTFVFVLYFSFCMLQQQVNSNHVHAKIFMLSNCVHCLLKILLPCLLRLFLPLSCFYLAFLSY